MAAEGVSAPDTDLDEGLSDWMVSGVDIQL